MAETRIAAELMEPGGSLIINSRPMMEVPSKGALIKIHFAGLCHSDLHMQDNFFKGPDGNDVICSQICGLTYPIVLCHEAAGVVYEVGCEYDGDISVGTEVIIFPWIGCNLPNCGACTLGETAICSEGTGRTFIGGPRIGGFSSFLSVPDCRYLIKKPPSVPMHVAALLPCSALTAYNAVIKASSLIEKFISIKGHGTLMINGLGGVGMWAVQFARLLLPDKTKIVTADISQSKLELAKDLGADEVILINNDDENTQIGRIRNLSVDNGMDAIIDFVANDRTAKRNFSCLLKGGALVTVGLFGGGLTLSLPVVALGSMSVIGMAVGSLEQLQEVVKIAADNKISPPPVTFYDLDDINVAIETLRNGKMNGRAVIKHKI